jgi:hypothetical protein
MFNVGDYVISRKTKRYGRIRSIKGRYAFLKRHNYKGTIREELVDLEIDINEEHWGDVL